MRLEVAQVSKEGRVGRGKVQQVTMTEMECFAFHFVLHLTSSFSTHIYIRAPIIHTFISLFRIRFSSYKSTFLLSRLLRANIIGTLQKKKKKGKKATPYVSIPESPFPINILLSYPASL